MKPSLSLNTRLSTRQATAADIEKIGLFLTEMLREFDLDLDHYGVDSDLMRFPESYQGGCFGLIEDDIELKIVGTFALYAMSDQVAEIRKMYLHPTLRGQGIGKQLLNFIEEQAKEIGFARLELETATAMQAARALYEKNGFIELAPMHNKARCQHRYFKQLK
jgi:putative acetyltransferase